MSRVGPFFSIVLLLLAIFLALRVRALRGEQSRWPVQVTRPSASLADESRPPSAASRPVLGKASHAGEKNLVASPLPGQSTTVPPRLSSRALQRERRNTLSRYVAGLDALNLSPEKLAEAKAVLVTYWQARSQANRHGQTLEETIESSRQAESAFDRQIAALLGHDAFFTLKSATLEGPLDWTAGTDLWDAGEPLRPRQLQALAQAGYRDSFPFVAPKGDQIPDPSTGLSRQDTVFLAAAASVLSPRQLEIFQVHLVEENRYNAAMAEFSRRQRSAMPPPK